MEQSQTVPQAPGLDELLSRRAAATDARLKQYHGEVAAETSRTDSKASALLSAFGLPLAVLVALAPGRDLPFPVLVLMGLGAAGLVAAMLMVLFVLCPRLGGNARGSYLHWATCTPEEIRAAAAVDRTADRVAALSPIAETKFRWLKIAIITTAGSLVLLLGALAAGLALG